MLVSIALAGVLAWLGSERFVDAIPVILLALAAIITEKYPLKLVGSSMSISLSALYVALLAAWSGFVPAFACLVGCAYFGANWSRGQQIKSLGALMFHTAGLWVGTQILVTSGTVPGAVTCAGLLALASLGVPALDSRSIIPWKAFIGATAILVVLTLVVAIFVPAPKALASLAVVPIWVVSGQIIHEFTRIEAQRTELLLGLQLAMRGAHPYTHGHMERVALLAERVGREAGLSRKQARKLREAAILHDIGKLGIDEQILEKPGKLTDQEFAAIKTHSEIGAKILESCPQFMAISPWILAHHERPDGRGYPLGKTIEEIPIESRIIAVVDAFDAMVGGTTGEKQRSYRKSLDPHEALVELDRCAGTQFDPEIVAAFRKAVREVSE